MKVKFSSILTVSALLATTAHADPFINGGFETGNTTGWTVSNAVYRGGSGVFNDTVTPEWVFSHQSPNGAMHSAVIDTTYVDPRVGSVIGSTVYAGNYALRVEDTNTGGYASAVTQTVSNYTEDSINFVWKAVMLGAHNDYDAATFKIVLRDLTDGVDLITRDYNAATGGSIFSTSGSNYYTKDWQIETLAIDEALKGHDFMLSLVAADCQPTAHWGYVYLDGFGSVAGGGGDDTNNVPEPVSLALFGLGLLSMTAARRRKIS